MILLLLLQEFVRQVSVLWAPLIIAIWLFAFTIFSYLLAMGLYSLSIGESSIAFFTPTPLFFTIGFFPLYCLAYANAAIDTIKASFVFQCTPTNYEIIGGREQWILYIEQSPAYWTVFGYAITWNVLYSVLISVVGSVLLGFASVLGRE